VDKPGTGVYSVGQHVRANTSKIPRADVADLMLNELEAGSLLQKAVTITSKASHQAYQSVHPNHCRSVE